MENNNEQIVEKKGFVEATEEPTKNKFL